jgi:hypothetical protein
MVSHSGESSPPGLLHDPRGNFPFLLASFKSIDRMLKPETLRAANL